jgi:regulator of sigma E protease
VLVTVAAFLIVIGVLIFVHELGHFLVAKAVGVQVLRFSLGFGRPLLQWRRGETEYWVSWIPLGGYVKMAGLEDEGMAGELEGGKSEAPVDPARAFDRKPLWARFAVILAGVTMNFLFAVVVYAGLAYQGTLDSDLIATTQVDTVRVSELPAVATPLAVLRRGDRITHVNDDSVRTWSQLVEGLLTADSPVRLRVAGRAEPIVLDLPPPTSRDTTDRFALVRNLTVYLPPVIATVSPGSPAAQAGLQSGDRLVRVGNDTIASWNDFARVARASPETPLQLVVLRGDTLRTVTVTPERRTDRDPITNQERSYGMIGVGAVRPTATAYGVIGAVGAGWDEAMQRTGQILTFLKRLLLGQASPRDLGGPITIAQVSGQAARVGLNVLLGFMAFLSINLAVLNLLPIPILDGGQLTFLVAEGVRRKPLSLKLRLRLTQLGFAVIAVLMLFVIGNELLRVLQRALS